MANENKSTVTLSKEIISAASIDARHQNDKIAYLENFTLQTGISRHREWDLENAKKHYETHLSLNPGNLDAIYLLASSEYRLGNIPAALKGLARSIKRSQDPAPPLANLRTYLLEIAKESTQYDSFQNYLNNKKVEETEWQGAIDYLREISDIQICSYLSWISSHHNSTKSKMNRKILASVIVPAFNAAPFIKECLGSILTSIKYFKQKTDRHDDEIEIIIIDDASTDDTAQTAFEWINMNEDIDTTYHRNKKNMGAGYSRNKGVEISNGEFIFFLDTDDFFYGHHISSCIQALEDDESCGFARTGICYDRKIHPDWIHNIEWISPINVAIRRHCFDLTGGFPEKDFYRTYSEEDSLWSPIVNSLFTFVRITEPTVYYRNRKGNSFDRQLDIFLNPADKPRTTQKESEKEQERTNTFRRINEALETMKIKNSIQKKAKNWMHPQKIGEDDCAHFKKI